ncbi:MAG: ABC transporter permease, partial [Planctomycetes bacterium]|nr:ABC transporter permease [Planctomycetota bacterium]
IRQPVFLLLMAVALISLVLNTFLPFFSLGEDIKMLKDVGLATILICGLLLAVWSASTGISAEIEGRTTMTLLSKPINRRQFIVGKYLGILQAVLWLVVPVSIAFLFLIYFKVGYDARESGTYDANVFVWYRWLPIDLAGIKFSLPLPAGPRLESALHVLPPLALLLLEIAVMTAVSVALATRLPMVLNVVTCLVIFVVGHLTPMLVKTVFQQQGLEFVSFTAQLIATVLPSLEAFNTQTAIAKSTIIPPAYLGLSALYCVAYAGAAIFLAFILFEDRDLA